MRDAADTVTPGFQVDDPVAPQQGFGQLLKQNRLAMIGLAVFVVFFCVALLGLGLTSGRNPTFDPAVVRLQEKLRPPLSKPNLETLSTEEVPRLGVYLFGTDDLGRDVFARMLQGAWVSLTVGFVAVGISVLIGIFMGGIAGYFGQSHTFIDTLIMRFVDIMLCFPSFFLILTVVALLPASMYNIMIVIGLTSWMGTTRFVRAEFLSLREQDFVTAARALGVGNFRIIFRHMIPNAMAPVLVSATIGIATAILTEAGLSFLGFGVPPPHATWGGILSDGKRFIFDAPWLTFAPGFAILIVVLSFNLFGEGLRDILNPKLRERQ
ncbi:MAG: ABC transporter permease [Deltaproteobacteria bacterium]|nr:ABC transporter permease [Deltaproteobacteria bacterium]